MKHLPGFILLALLVVAILAAGQSGYQARDVILQSSGHWTRKEQAGQTVSYADSLLMVLECIEAHGFVCRTPGCPFQAGITQGTEVTE